MNKRNRITPPFEASSSETSLGKRSYSISKVSRKNPPNYAKIVVSQSVPQSFNDFLNVTHADATSTETREKLAKLPPKFRF